MSDKHLSSQFDSELHSVSTRVMELGGLVESQLLNAIYALPTVLCHTHTSQTLPGRGSDAEPEHPTENESVDVGVT